MLKQIKKAILRSLGLWESQNIELTKNPYSITKVSYTQADDIKPQTSRFQQSIELLKALDDKINYSKIEDACSFLSEQHVMNMAANQETASLDDLKCYALKFNVNVNWLLHGEGHPFADLTHIEPEAHTLAKKINSIQPQEIFFVRDIESNSFCIVTRTDKSFHVHHKYGNWQISDETGNGGQGQTTSLYVLIQWLENGFYYEYDFLSKIKIPFRLQSNLCGVELNRSSDFDDLITGKIHPSAIINHYQRKSSTWWVAFCDIEYKLQNRNQYEFTYGTALSKAQDIVRFMIGGNTRYQNMLS